MCEACQFGLNIKIDNVDLVKHKTESMNGNIKKFFTESSEPKHARQYQNKKIQDYVYIKWEYWSAM